MIMLGTGIGFLPESGFSVAGLTSHGSSITITGSGFGSKPQAAPIVWDMGAEVYIDGVEDTAHAVLADGAAVIGEIYGSGVNVVMSLNRTHRHSNVDRHYTTDNDFGRSSLHTSNLSKFDGTDVSRQIFSSFKIKWPSLNPSRIDGVNFTNLTGTFTEGVDGELGEAITITYNSENFAGNILNVGLGPSGYLSTQLGIYSPNLNITSATTPFTIVGDVSGATADCETSSPYRAQASGKLWRINQKSQDGVLSIVQVSNSQFWVESNLNNTDEIGMNRNTYAIPHGDVIDFTGWMHVEQLVDFRVGTAIKAEYRAAGNLSSVTKNIPGQDGSTNILDQWCEIHIFGYDASVEHAFVVDYGELYVDSTPQRAVVGNNTVYADCTELEFQRPTAWSDTGITCIVNVGGLGSLVGNYLYVNDVENVAAKIGQWV